MMRAGRTCLVAGAALASIAASAAIRPHPVVVWNASASVPVGLYAVVPIRDPKVGDLVAVRPPPAFARWLAAPGYLGRGMPLLKHIAASAGAEVCRNGTTILIDGMPVAEAMERDRRGRRLAVWRGCRTLAECQVFFLNADEPASLDGRYFGPLDDDTIIGRAVPLWMRDG